MPTLHDVMTKDVEVIHPASTVRESAEKMRDLDVGFLPVCDGYRFVGAVTDRDIVIRGLAEGRDTSQAVADVMSTDVLYCYADQDVREAAQMMERHQVRRLLVLDREKNLAGVVSLGDLATETEDDRMKGAVLEQVSQPSGPKR